MSLRYRRCGERTGAAGGFLSRGVQLSTVAESTWSPLRRSFTLALLKKARRFKPGIHAGGFEVENMERRETGEKRDNHPPLQRAPGRRSGTAT